FGSSMYPNLCTTSEKEGLVAGAALATSSIDSSPPEPSVDSVCVEVGVGVELDDGGGNLWRREDNLSWRAMISSPCCPPSAVSALTARSNVWNLPPIAMMLSIPSSPLAWSITLRIPAGVSDSIDPIGETSGTVLPDLMSSRLSSMDPVVLLCRGAEDDENPRSARNALFSAIASSIRAKKASVRAGCVSGSGTSMGVSGVGCVPGTPSESPSIHPDGDVGGKQGGEEANSKPGGTDEGACVLSPNPDASVFLPSPRAIGVSWTITSEEGRTSSVARNGGVSGRDVRVSGSAGVDSMGDGALARGAIRFRCSFSGSPSSKGTISFFRPSSMSSARWKGNIGPALTGAAVLFRGDSDRARTRPPVA